VRASPRRSADRAGGGGPLGKMRPPGTRLLRWVDVCGRSGEPWRCRGGACPRLSAQIMGPVRYELVSNRLITRVRGISADRLGCAQSNDRLFFRMGAWGLAVLGAVRPFADRR